MNEFLFCVVFSVVFCLFLFCLRFVASVPNVVSVSWLSIRFYLMFIDRQLYFKQDRTSTSYCFTKHTNERHIRLTWKWKGTNLDILHALLYCLGNTSPEQRGRWQAYVCHFYLKLWMNTYCVVALTPHFFDLLFCEVGFHFSSLIYV